MRVKSKRKLVRDMDMASSVGLMDHILKGIGEMERLRGEEYLRQRKARCWKGNGRKM